MPDPEIMTNEAIRAEMSELETLKEFTGDMGPGGWERYNALTAALDDTNRRGVA